MDCLCPSYVSVSVNVVYPANSRQLYFAALKTNRTKNKT